MENQISPQTNFTRCVKFFYFSLLLPSVWRYFWLSATIRRLIAPVVLELRAGLSALVKATSNRRFYLGLVLLLVGTPLMGVAYQLFDRHIKDPSWYYINHFYLFLVLCPHASVVTALLGMFFVFPKNSKRAYFLILPAGSQMAKILWLIKVESNEDFYRLVPYSFWFTGVLLIFFVFFFFDWLMSLHFHKREVVVDRILGIIDTPGLPDRRILEIARQEKQNLLKPIY